VVSADSLASFYDALMQLINSPVLLNKFGAALNNIILSRHSEEAVIAKYINWLKNELKC
jgi:glycosyltransferase involved in cell wall biosynthesis